MQIPMSKIQDFKSSIQILPNSDLKASMRVENSTHYSSATNKTEVQIYSLGIICHANIYSDQNLFGEKGFMNMFNLLWKKIYTYIFFHNRLNTYFIYVCVFQLRLSELFFNRSNNIETNCNLNEWIRFGFIFSAVLSLMSWKFCRELKLPDQSNNLSPEC